MKTPVLLKACVATFFLMINCESVIAQQGQRQVTRAEISWLPTNADFFVLGPEPFFMGDTAEMILESISSGRPTYVITGAVQDRNGNYETIYFLQVRHLPLPLLEFG